MECRKLCPFPVAVRVVYTELNPWRVSTPMGPSAVDVGTVGLGVVSELSPVVGYTV